MQSPYNFDFYQGATFSALLAITDSNDDVINLNGYTIFCRVKEKYSASTGVLNLSGVASTPASGYVTLSATAAQTAALPCNQYIYDVQAFTTNSGDSISLLWGYINVNPRTSF